MPRVTFILQSGDEQIVDATIGASLMEAAINAGVPGIEAECYGACNCGTCHVYVDSTWQSEVGKRGEWEGEVVATLSLARDNSRLSCQILMREALNGLVVRIPDFQGDKAP